MTIAHSIDYPTKAVLTFSTDQVCKKIDELIAFGGTEVGFNGGFHPKLKIKDYAELFKKFMLDILT